MKKEVLKLSESYRISKRGDFLFYYVFVYDCESFIIFAVFIMNEWL